MRITKQKAAENRGRVVEEAARLFREKGFDGVGVAELMAAAGMTHGGFYNHFGSKDEVEAAACERLFEASVAKMTADRRGARRGGARRGVRRLPRTLCVGRCARRDRRLLPDGRLRRRRFAPERRRARRLCARACAPMSTAFAKASGAERAEALRAFSTLAGALTLARSVAARDPALSDEILAAARGCDVSLEADAPRRRA